MDDEYMSLVQATREFDISHQTLWRRIKAGVLPTFRSERNRRVVLVRRSDLEAMMQPRPIRGEEKKAAA